ncbi:hypothetical protein ACIBSW_40495 [Actinoplanes sp. NPDC049668]|uniref:hypothetical protein n=1 Tax=unclassified Actinoplanes TaxID=2626549 RepID=UPI0033A1C4CE
MNDMHVDHQQSDVTDAEFDSWLRGVNTGIRAAVDDVVDTEADLVRLKQSVAQKAVAVDHASGGSNGTDEAIRAVFDETTTIGEATVLVTVHSGLWARRDASGPGPWALEYRRRPRLRDSPAVIRHWGRRAKAVLALQVGGGLAAILIPAGIGAAVLSVKGSAIVLSVTSMSAALVGAMSALMLTRWFGFGRLREEVSGDERSRESRGSWWRDDDLGGQSEEAPAWAEPARRPGWLSAAKVRERVRCSSSTSPATADSELAEPDGVQPRPFCPAGMTGSPSAIALDSAIDVEDEPYAADHDPDVSSEGDDQRPPSVRASRGAAHGSRRRQRVLVMRPAPQRPPNLGAGRGARRTKD